MFVLILGNLPLPFVLYLNWLVTVKFWRIHQATQHAKLQKPPRLILGWCLNTFSNVFVLIPIISERRIFVQNPRWLLSFAVAATLTITGLSLMNNALGKELAALTPRRRAKRGR